MTRHVKGYCSFLNRTGLGEERRARIRSLSPRSMIIRLNGNVECCSGLKVINGFGLLHCY